jgi:hypothetical protein
MGVGLRVVNVGGSKEYIQIIPSTPSLTLSHLNLFKRENFEWS